MVSNDSGQRRRPEYAVAVLTWRGRVAWSPHRPRVMLSRLCAIDPTGVALYRWPMRSAFIPLERVDRFDVVLREVDPGSPEGLPTGIAYRECLALLTRDGEKLLVSAPLTRLMRGLPLGTCPLQLNNHILATRRAARPSEDDPQLDPPQEPRRIGRILVAGYLPPVGGMFAAVAAAAAMATSAILAGISFQGARLTNPACHRSPPSAGSPPSTRHRSRPTRCGRPAEGFRGTRAL
jgi:hypothetical protein